MQYCALIMEGYGRILQYCELILQGCGWILQYLGLQVMELNNGAVYIWGLVVIVGANILNYTN